MSKISEEKADEIYDACDLNKDGEVSDVELYKGLSKYLQCQMSVDQVAEIFSGLDHNKDKKVTRKEFKDEMCHKIDRRTGFSDAFKELDKNNDGTLTPDELQGICKKFGYSEEEIEGMIASCDKNNDGKISRKEFMTLI